MPALDVFISHAEQDADVAVGLARALEAEGYATWYYERDSVPGPSYLVQVGQAVERCAAIIVIVSPHSIRSRQVTTEVVRAHEGGKVFIPVLCGISHSEFQQRQPEWREAFGGAVSVVVPAQGVEAIAPRIIGGLRALGAEPHGTPRTGEEPAFAPPVALRTATRPSAEQWPQWRRQLYLAVGCAVAVVALVVWWRLGHPRSSGPVATPAIHPRPTGGGRGPQRVPGSRQEPTPGAKDAGTSQLPKKEAEAPKPEPAQESKPSELSTLAMLKVTSEPPGATVALEGLDSGKATPCEITTDLGAAASKKVVVTIMKRGFMSSKSEVTLRAGRAAKLAVKLKADPRASKSPAGSSTGTAAGAQTARGGRLGESSMRRGGGGGMSRRGGTRGGGGGGDLGAAGRSYATRAEVAAALYAGFPSVLTAPPAERPGDVPANATWTQAILVVIANGLMDAPAGRFWPEDPMPRYQLAETLAGLARRPLAPVPTPPVRLPSDVPSDHSAREALRLLYTLGVFRDDPFRGDAFATLPEVQAAIGQLAALYASSRGGTMGGGGGSTRRGGGRRGGSSGARGGIRGTRGSPPPPPPASPPPS